MDDIDLYLTELERVIHDLSREAVRAVADKLMDDWQARRQIFIIGNGGSAATSASGNSPNVVKAMQYAQSIGGTVIGLCGRPGGLLAQHANLKVIVPSDRIGQQEYVHMALDHVLVFALQARIARLAAEKGW